MKEVILGYPFHKDLEFADPIKTLQAMSFLINCLSSKQANHICYLNNLNTLNHTHNKPINKTQLSKDTSNNYLSNKKLTSDNRYINFSFKEFFCSFNQSNSFDQNHSNLINLYCAYIGSYQSIHCTMQNYLITNYIIQDYYVLVRYADYLADIIKDAHIYIEKLCAEYDSATTGTNNHFFDQLIFIKKERLFSCKLKSLDLHQRLSLLLKHIKKLASIVKKDNYYDLDQTLLNSLLVKYYYPKSLSLGFLDLNHINISNLSDFKKYNYKKYQSKNQEKNPCQFNFYQLPLPDIYNYSNNYFFDLNHNLTALPAIKLLKKTGSEKDSTKNKSIAINLYSQNPLFEFILYESLAKIVNVDFDDFCQKSLNKFLIGYDPWRSFLNYLYKAKQDLATKDIKNINLNIVDKSSLELILS